MDIEKSDSKDALSPIPVLAVSWDIEKQQELADRMFNGVLDEIPILIKDQHLSSMGKGTCLAIVELVLMMIEHSIPAERAEPPVVAIEYARSAAERGLALEELLRIYRLGHACLSWALTDVIMESTSDPTEQVRTVRETERFLFTSMDIISSKMSAAYVDQRQRVLSRTAPARLDVVQALLNGSEINITHAEHSLGHSLTGPQLAFICWSDDDPTAPEQAAMAMQDVLSAPRPVLVPGQDYSLSGWFDLSRGDPAPVENLAKAAGAAAPAAHVAIGPIMSGISGFRESHVGASRVRRVVNLSARQAPTLTEWANIALVDALSADLDAARILVRSELGALSRAGGHTEMLRHTAHAFVVSGFSYAAVSSRLHIHRNTALQRVRKAEALRGKPLNERPAELLAALALVDVVAAALSEPRREVAPINGTGGSSPLSQPRERW